MDDDVAVVVVDVIVVVDVVVAGQDMINYRRMCTTTNAVCQVQFKLFFFHFNFVSFCIFYSKR